MNNPLFINNDSPFLNLPLGLNKRDVFFLEGIRYTINSISISYDILKHDLVVLSKNGSSEKEISPIKYRVFNLAWTIIDNASRFRKLIMSMNKLGSENTVDDANKINIKYLTEVNSFRNTFQHIDERIDHNILDNNDTVFGVLKWIYSTTQDKPIHSFFLTSGHLRMGEHSPIINPTGKYISPPICMITLESVDKKKKQNKIEINISNLVNSIYSTIKELEKLLKDQLPQDAESHPQDIFIGFEISQN